MLIRYELSKIFCRRVLWIAFAAFLLINAFQLTQATPYHGKSDPNYNYYAGRRLMYSKVEGPFTNEKIDFVLDGWDTTYPSIMSPQEGQQIPNDKYYTKTPYDDFAVYDELKEEMQRQYEYNDSIKALKGYAQENLAYMGGLTDTYEGRRNQLILDTYGERTIHSFYDQTGLGAYLKYDFSSLLVLLLLLLGISPIISSEKEAGMAPLLASSRFGRHKTIAAKIGAMALFTAFFAACFFLMDFLYYMVVAEFHVAGSALYTLIDFKYTPLTCTIWQYILLQWLAKWLGMIAVGLFFVLLSSIFRETYPVFVLGTGLIALFMAVGERFRLFNPISMLTFSEQAQELSTFNFFGYPVLTIVSLPISILLLVLVLVLLIFLVNHKQWHVSVTGLWNRKRGKAHE